MRYLLLPLAIALALAVVPAAGTAAQSPDPALTCPYAAPGSTATTPRPRYVDDPVNGTVQGFNPIAGQAARIAQLRAWGWRVEWQFVDGSARADSTDRLFMMIFCDPPKAP